MDRPEDALATLTTPDAAEAEKMANVLDAHNRDRQEEEMRIHKEALQKLKEECDPSDPVIVLGSRDWHPGVVGIVASRLMRRFHKPAFIIAIDGDGLGKGSGRSIGGVSLMDAINANRDLLVAGGGHAMAAGISVDENKIAAFREGFARYVRENVSENDRLPRLHIDAEITFAELSLDFLKSYELLQPFGSCNPEPIFISRKVYLTEPPRELKTSPSRGTLPSPSTATCSGAGPACKSSSRTCASTATTRCDRVWTPSSPVTPSARWKDLLDRLPRRYEDRRRFDAFPVQAGGDARCLRGVVVDTRMRRFGGRKHFYEAVVIESGDGNFSSNKLLRGRRDRVR